jgi:hypothetical protein
LTEGVRALLEKRLTEGVRALLEKRSGKLPAIAGTIVDPVIRSALQDRAMSLEDPVLGLQFLPGRALRSRAAGTAEPAHVQAAHVTADSASTGTHDGLTSGNSNAEIRNGSEYDSYEQYAPFRERKKTVEENEFELDKSVVSQKIQEGGHAGVFFLVL